MVYKKVIKKGVVSMAFFLIATLNLTNPALADESKNSCKNINGKFYIATEYAQKCGVLEFGCPFISQVQSYDNVLSCSIAAIEKYGCIPAVEDRVFYGTGNTRINFNTNTVSLADAKSCLTNLAQSNLNRNNNSLGTNSYCSAETKFFQCKCTTNLLGTAGILGDFVAWSTGNKTYNCYLNPVSGVQLRNIPEVKPQSPVAFIKTLSNVFFYLAVFLFVINFLRIGMMYTRSQGSPDNLKKARALLFNNISGMVFLLLVSGLIIFTNNEFGF